MIPFHPYRNTMKLQIILYSFISTCMLIDAFSPMHRHQMMKVPISSSRFNPLSMSEPISDVSKPESSTTESVEEEEVEEEMTPMDAATREMEEKMRRADELRAQEVFIKRSTGKHNCGVCDFTYEESKGDIVTIGGTIPPGTPFSELPSNWRCPTCRASKDQFVEVVEEIPGFEVNQGYGFGGNSLTSGQKNTLIFGGLGLFFLLFLSGYAMS